MRSFSPHQMPPGERRSNERYAGYSNQESSGHDKDNAG
jgi:hypothetical protein